MLTTRWVPQATPARQRGSPAVVPLFSQPRWQAAAVWMAWGVMLAWIVSFVARHGHNLPTCDEWAFVPITYAPWSERVAWLGATHMEHRFPLARVVYLCLLDATHQDYRTGMWMTVGLFALTSAALILAARRLRGHTSLADMGFAFLFLHPGHTENLLMGYQIAFTITALSLGLFALLVAGAGNAAPGRCALRGALLLIPIAMGGLLGLIFTLPLGAWVGWQLLRAREASALRRIGVWFVLVAVAGYFAWSVWGALHSPAQKQAHETLNRAMRIHGVAEAAGIGLGPVSGQILSIRMMGWMVIGVEAITACGLLLAGWLRREERPVAWGLLAILLGVWAFALAVGYSRGNGIASRDGAFTAFGPAITLLAASRYLWRPRGVDLMLFLVLVGACYLGLKIQKHGRIVGHAIDGYYANVVEDVSAGMPIDVLAARHFCFWLKTTSGWEELWKHDFPLLRDIPAPRETRPMAAQWHPLERKADDPPNVDRYRVDLGGRHEVAAIHLQFRSDMQATWVPLEFQWTDPSTGATRRSIVYPWVRSRKLDTVFWIDGPIDGGELRITNERCHISVIEVAYSAK